jgi:hypothetical protein
MTKLGDIKAEITTLKKAKKPNSFSLSCLLHRGFGIKDLEKELEERRNSQS